jgi:hypothetical protein
MPALGAGLAVGPSFGGFARWSLIVSSLFGLKRESGSKPNNQSKIHGSA